MEVERSVSLFSLWPHYITIANTDNPNAGGSEISGPYKIRMSDNWAGDVKQTTRFGIPQDTEQFLKMANEFRSPERLITTTLRPAVTSSLDSVANLYSMEEYWSGGKRDEFKTEFELALKKGRAAVDREMVMVDTAGEIALPAPSDSPLVEDSANVGNTNTQRIVTRKRLDAQGMEIRIMPDFARHAIAVSSAIVEDLDPDDMFEERIQERKEAASRRIIAREQRLEQEEQRLLAITRSERDMAERQGKARVEQIERTTNAETEKKLALVQAEQAREQARIGKETAAVNLDTSRIQAEATRIEAEAQAFAREKLIAADNALAQKLEAEVSIQRVWAEAYAKRAVPEIVVGGSSATGGAPVGSDGEVRALLDMLTVDTAKRLSYDRSVGDQKPVPPSK